MKYGFLTIIGASLTLSVGAKTLSDKQMQTPQQAYITKYATVAMEEMVRSGVPASITIAQGMLESGNGLSRLALEGNNHFGIKCHDWKGRTIKKDDEKRVECFRAYDDVRESFSDHSDFLRFRRRYESLFELDPEDYRGWAYGLKKAGYATDPSYPVKLIRIIEEYELSNYDVLALSGAFSTPKVTTEIQDNPLPPSPRMMEELSFSVTGTVRKVNGVRYVLSESGDNYEAIALRYDMFSDELLRYNDAAADGDLPPGTTVFLQRKRSQAAEGLDKYIVESDGEELRDIAQHYAVRLGSLMRLNGFSPGHKLREGDTVILRRRSGSFFNSIHEKIASLNEKKEK